MKREAILKNVVLNPLGEIRMGCDAYGLIIETNFGDFDIFKDTPIIIGGTDYTRHIEQSKCKRYLLLMSDFGTYILDIKDQAISIYRITMRGLSNEWIEEQAIFGNDKNHINGFSRNYYLQYPFVRKKLFHETLKKYKTLRRAQIEEAVNFL